MADKIEECAWKVWKALVETGRLNLWEARAILGESRDFTSEVLLWLASRSKIMYFPSDDQLYIAPAEKERKGHGEPALAIA
jgi:hypothetical protein